jgi:hypothetical protein
MSRMSGEVTSHHSKRQSLRSWGDITTAKKKCQKNKVGRELVQLSPSLGTFFPTASKKKLWQSNLAMENGPFDDWSMISIVVFHSKFSAYHKHDGPQNPGRCDCSNLRTSRKTLRCLVNPFMVAIGMHTSTLRFSTPQISPITI